MRTGEERSGKVYNLHFSWLIPSRKVITIVQNTVWRLIVILLTISYVCIARLTLSSPYSLLLLKSFWMSESDSVLLSGERLRTLLRYESARLSTSFKTSENKRAKNIKAEFYSSLFRMCINCSYILELEEKKKRCESVSNCRYSFKHFIQKKWIGQANMPQIISVDMTYLVIACQGPS